MVLSMFFLLYIGSGFLASVRVRWQAADECSILDVLDGSSAQRVALQGLNTLASFPRRTFHVQIFSGIFHLATTRKQDLRQ
jgi:hypothetical protein